MDCKIVGNCCGAIEIWGFWDGPKATLPVIVKYLQTTWYNKFGEQPYLPSFYCLILNKHTSSKIIKEFQDIGFQQIEFHGIHPVGGKTETPDLTFMYFIGDITTLTGPITVGTKTFGEQHAVGKD